MIKKTKVFFISLILILIILFLYLTVFGIETNRFNKTISDKIRSINPEIDLNLKKIKLQIKPLKLKIYLVTENPQILISNKKLRLKKISTNYNIKSFFKKDFGIRNINLETDYNNLKDVIKLSRSLKDSPQLLIFDKISKSGKIIIYAKLKIDEKGKIKNNYFISGQVKDYSIKLLNNENINKINFSFQHSPDHTNLIDIDFEYKNLPITSNKFKITKKNKSYLISGNIENSKSRIDENIFKNFIKNVNLKNLILSSKNNFSFELDRKLKIKNLNLKSYINLESAEYYLDTNSFNKILPKLKKKIDIKKNKIYLEYKDNLRISGEGELIISEKKEKINYEIKNFKNDTQIKIKLSLNKTPLKFDLLNFYKKKDIDTELNINFEKNEKNTLIKNLSIISHDNKFKIEDLLLNNKNKILDFKNIKLNYEDKNKIKNDLYIRINGKNSYLVKGKNFSLNSIIENILTGEKTKNFELFDNKERFFKLMFNENNIDNEHIIYGLSGEAILIGNRINKLNLKSEFKNSQKVTLSIFNKNSEMVTTFYSDFAKPFVKKFKFIKGFDGGKINFSSSKIKNSSYSQLNISDFKLKELPALTKLLTLASLQGIADLLTGEGVRFDEFEMTFSNKGQKIIIDEIYSIGPAISILMEGYIQKHKLVSLKGTLVPATTINKFVSSIPLLGDILVGKKTGEGVFGVSFKIKGPPKDLKTTVNPIKTLTPRFITRTLEKIKKTN